jgi:hypothetical protein
MKAKFVNIKWRLLGKFNGIALVPFVFVFGNPYTGSRLAVFRNHENIHVRQVEDTIKKHMKYVWKLGYVTGWVAWYVSYLYKWISNVKKYGGGAYRNISYEREAYSNQYNLQYLNKRKPFQYKEYEDGR